MTLAEWRATIAGWWVTIKHEGAHYWAGFKLFGFELKVATRLVLKQLKGGALTRRERKQLTRTAADIFRMVPFTLFIVVPFAELLLPIALRLFPNMLPSTFQTQLKQEEDMKKLLVAKTELARFLQQTVAEVAKDVKRSRSGAVADDARALYNFLRDVRSGRAVSNDDLMRFASLFSDEITLDNLDRVHLVTLCQFLGLSPLGTETFLRMRLSAHLNEVRADDIEIRKEGIAELTDDELRQACRARGMPAPFGAGCREIMQHSLEDWIELSLDKNIPQSLLLLSRAFTLGGPAKRKLLRSEGDATEKAVEALRNTFNMLPEETLADVEMDRFKGATSLEKRLEYMQRVDADIRQEEASSEAEAAAMREALEASQKRLDMVEAKARATAKAVVSHAKARAERAILDTVVPSGADAKAAPPDSKVSNEEAAFLTAKAKEERLRRVITSLMALASASGVAQERELFLEVAREQVASAVAELTVANAAYLEFARGELSAVRPEREVTKPDKVAAAVSASVQRMLISLERDLDRAEDRIGARMHLLDRDGDGVISRDEFVDALAFLGTELTGEEMATLEGRLSGGGVIRLDELARIREEAEQARSRRAASRAPAPAEATAPGSG